MRNLGLGALVFLAMASAKAGILIEPYFAMESGTLTQKVANTDIGGSTSATILGARLGYKLPLMLWVAADYSMATGGKFKALTVSYDYTRTNLNLDVGIDFPILFRAWLGFGLNNEMKLTEGSTNTFFKEGGFTKLGVAYSGLPFISINFEYYTWAPNKYTDANGTTSSASSTFSDLKDTGFNVGVSLPFNL